MKESVLSYAQIADWVQTNCLGNQTNVSSENQGVTPQRACILSRLGAGGVLQADLSSFFTDFIFYVILSPLFLFSRIQHGCS